MSGGGFAMHAATTGDASGGKNDARSSASRIIHPRKRWSTGQLILVISFGVVVVASIFGMLLTALLSEASAAGYF